METESTTVAWGDVLARRPVDNEAVAIYVERLKAAERSWRLREIREEQGMTQKE